MRIPAARLLAAPGSLGDDGLHDDPGRLFAEPLAKRPEVPGGLSPLEILISEERIRERIAELGTLISADYQGKPLTIVAILTGSIVLLADLIRQVRIPHRVALLQASSYKGATTQAGSLRINDAFAPDLRGRHVLLLDDILDTGHTLATIVGRMDGKGALSVRTAVLLRKVGRQEVPLEPDYCGFTIPDAFVVGYGLDYDDDYRHLPHVAILPPPPPSPLLTPKGSEETGEYPAPR
jgi:hypoxanthine phosphoribosyltransferase